MKSRKLGRAAAGAMAALLCFTSVNFPVCAEEADVAQIQSRVCVHDPSIVKDSNTGTYYVFGSHLADAKSSNLIDWEQMNVDWNFRENENDWKQDSVYGTTLENLSESFEWAGYNDGDSSNGGLGVWAPDVIWNPEYKNSDGSIGAWMMYYSTSSTWRRSCIGYAVSKNIEGPYDYVDTVIYSGFTKNGAVDGNSTRNTKWDNDYLNLKELVEKGSDQGGIDAVSDQWFDSEGNWNQNTSPNAIDPTIFFEEDDTGKKMYMVYGSWSGGLFVLELDTETGAVKYPGTDNTDQVSGNRTDRYFGTHIAGGNHQSGEGAFILYDKESSYYYLYETYGGLTAAGGYNMRMFRSQNPTGPYVDAAGNDAADSGNKNDLYGIKLIGNYQFFNQPGYRSAGHNSALIDEDGQRYLLYHQRFDQPENQTEYHELRVHQQFLNEDNWPVTAVYENLGEEISHYEQEQIVGSYEVVNHGTATNGNMIASESIQLNADGTVTGDYTGTWEKKSGTEYDYVTLYLGNSVFKGVLFQQYNEADTPVSVMTFSAIGTNNECLWGSKLSVDDQNAAERAAAQLDSLMPEAAREDLELPQKVLDAEISWESEKESVLSSEGVVHKQKQDETVNLTARVTYGSAMVERTYTVKVYKIPSLIYGFDFETQAGEMNELVPQTGSGKSNAALLQGTAAVGVDEERGNVLSIVNEAGAKGVNYLKLPEDTLTDVTEAGYTVSMWVNLGQDTAEHSALFEADKSGTYPMTRIGANLIARINANGYSDVQGDLLQTSGEREVWQQVSYAVSPDGIQVFLNGTLAGEEEKNLRSCFDISNEYSIQKAVDVAIGSGYIWGDEDIREAVFDDIKVYDGAITEEEAGWLYTENALKLPQQITVVAGTAIEKTTEDSSFQLGAAVTQGDGVLSYSSSQEGVATVDQTGNVTVKGAGTAVITITASETAQYCSAITKVTLKVTEKDSGDTEDSKQEEDSLDSNGSDKEDTNSTVDAQIDMNELVSGADNAVSRLEYLLSHVKGSVIQVITDEAPVLSSSLLKKMAESNKTITVIIAERSGKMQYSWTFAAGSITNTQIELNLAVSFQSTSQSAIETLTGQKDLYYLSFAHHGDLPGEVKFQVCTEEKYQNGTTVYLYYYNADKGRLESVVNTTTGGTAFTITDDRAEVTLTHCSDYVLSVLNPEQMAGAVIRAAAPKTGDTAPIAGMCFMLFTAALVAAQCYREKLVRK